MVLEGDLAAVSLQQNGSLTECCPAFAVTEVIENRNLKWECNPQWQSQDESLDHLSITPGFSIRRVAGTLSAERLDGSWSELQVALEERFVG